METLKVSENKGQLIKEDTKERPENCQQCGKKAKMIDSGDAMTEHWCCAECGIINIWNQLDSYRGGIPEKMIFSGLLF